MVGRWSRIWPASVRAAGASTIRARARPPASFPPPPVSPVHRKVGGHLVDPRRHPVSQGALDSEVGGVARLARGEFGRLFFGALLRRGELRPERLDMGLQRPDDLMGERPRPEPGRAARDRPRPERDRSIRPAAGSAFACRFRASSASARAWPVAEPLRATRSAAQPPADR